MTREQIIEAVVNGTQERLPEATVSHKTVQKNNGVVLNGINVTIDDHLGAVIYIDDGIEAVDNGKATIDDVVRRVISGYKEHRHPTFQVDDFMSRDFVLGKVHRCLINRAMNTALLEEVVSKDFFDLSIVYRVFVDPGASFIVRKDFLEKIEVTPEELDARAAENDQKEWTCDGMINTLLAMGGFLGFDTDELPSAEEDPILIVSNKNKMYGAAVITDTEYLSTILKEDYYIIPSSIHECILMPCTSEGNVEDFNQMVMAVNTAELSDEDVLSDHIFKFSAETKQIAIA